MTWALVSFAGGVFSTVLAFIVGYLTQLQLYNEDIQKSEQQAQATGKAEALKAIPEHHRWLLRIGIVLVFLATIAFGIGCWLAATTFAKA